MNRFAFLFGFLLFVMPTIQSQSVVGLWKNLDDEDGKEKSNIRIYEENGELKAKVVKLLPAATLKICTKCKGDLKNKPIEGMEIVWGLKKKSDKEYTDGEILNPKNGKVYRCNIKLEAENKLKVHGYLGVSLIGKSQYWFRVKE
jgi:uncharacterized protein (DUF2147 family)